MNLPFTRDDFLAVFGRYNEAVWPAPLLLLGAAIAAVFMSLGRWPARDRFVGLVLAGLWLWAGIVYHLGFFADVNRAAAGFGIGFALQGGLFVRAAMGAGRLQFGAAGRLRRVVGGGLLGYAFLGYPLVGTWLGHRWPDAPTFGAPCPVVLCTLGLLCWARPTYSRWLLVVPTVWALVASGVVVRFGLYEDAALLPAAVVAWSLRALGEPGKRRPPRTRAERAGVGHRIWRGPAASERRR